VHPGDGADIAFEVVYRTQRAPLVRLAYLIVRSEAVAEELVHDAFLRLHAHADEVGNPAGFLRTALVRLCLTWLRRAGVERDRLERLPPPAVVAEPPPDADGALWDALARLRPERRTALVLRFYADLDFAAVADHMGCPVTTARSHAHRGLRDLRGAILPQEGTT
jgi:RNA polymerase sigma factor (sigma-70 family)